MAYQKSADLKDSAKGHLAGKYYNAAMTCLLCSTLIFLVSQSASSAAVSLGNTITKLAGIAQGHPAVTVFSYLLLLLVSVLCNILNVGLALFFLNVSCNRFGSAFDLFYGYQEQFDKSFAISGVLILLRTICLLPADIGLYLYGRNQAIDTHTLLLLAPLQLLGLLLYIPLSLSLSQCYYLMLDFPEYSATRVMQLSCKIMKGHKKRLLYIEVSFLPLLLLNLFTLGVGSLWLTPYRQTTYALFFLDIMKPEPPTR